MDVRSSVVVASSSQMVTRQQRKRAVDAVMFQVLDNPSLREEILKHAIFGKDKVNRKAACTLRLVGKSWNESVVSILRKAHEHLFQLDEVTKEAADPFVETFAASPQVMGSIPPLAIHAFEFGVLCHPENLKSFSNCLTRCGDALIQLGFSITANGRPFKARLPNWSLPSLQKLDISTMQDLHDNSSRSNGQEEVAVEDDQNDDNLTTCLIKSVLSNATALSELNLNIGGVYPFSQEGSQFTVFDSIILPPSLTKFTGIIVGSIQHLEMLARSPLPNLASLTIHVASGPFSDGLIIRILDNCRKSLKTFVRSGIDDNGQPGAHDIARFPVMEQLVELSLDGVIVEPELGHGFLEKYFPKLATLRLPTQTIDNFEKWVGSSPLPGVTSLRLFLRQILKASLTTETMQRVNFVFPNLRKLEMIMSSDDSSGLEYIFREMRQLTELDIRVECTLEQCTSSDKWDSLLTGIPVETIARSWVDPDFWDRNDLEDESIASIKNLTELKRCSLNLYRAHHGTVNIRHYGHRQLTMRPCVSDFVFNCALLRMPNLTELRLARLSSFNVSQEMIAKWRNDGRSLTFY